MKYLNMASVKVKYRASKLPDHEGTIYYQIIHERKVRQLLTPYHIMLSEWNDTKNKIIVNPSNDRYDYVSAIKEQISWDLERIKKIISKFEHSGIAYNADDIIDRFEEYSKEYSLFNYMESLIVRLKNNGNIRTSETYKTTLNSFKKFRNNEDIGLDHVSAQIIEDYEAWNQKRGLIPNTISFYLRILRAVYNRAVEEDIIENKNPFRRVYTGVDKTIKRALSLSVIKKLKSLELSLSPSLEYARDIFLLSFYLRGMSFIDMAYLKKSDLKNGYIIYRRRKTGKQLTIEWTKEMQTIISKYPENKTDYLLPIIKKTNGINLRKEYLKVGYNINHNLKKIAEKLSIKIPLTLYVARHSWASIAKSKGIPTSVISEGMGHDSEATTQIYLASLDNSMIDKANALIIKSI